MNQNNYDAENLCRKCYIHLVKPTKKEIKQIVLTPYDEKCDNCGRVGQVVDYVGDDD